MQFCRIYTGADGKSHFEDFDQNQGAKHFLTGLDVKTLVFKNDMNREDLHGWHNAPRRQWCITLPALSRSVSATAAQEPSVPAMCFLPKILQAKDTQRCRTTGSERLFTCNRKSLQLEN